MTPKNKWISLLLCICTVFGHKLYEGRIGMGILYLCTGGLFGIGWLFDIIKLISGPTTYYVAAKTQRAGVPAAMPQRANAQTYSAPIAATQRTQSAMAVNNALYGGEYQQRRAEALARKRAEFANELNAVPRVEIALSDELIKRRRASDMPEFKFMNITRATRLETLFPLVVVDVETTGIKLTGNDIIEVSAIKFDAGFVPVSCFTTLVKPRNPIPPEAAAINHITDDMVAGSPSFCEIAPAFSQYISGCSVVGHNLGFDLKFLFVSGVELSEKVRYYDTLKLAEMTLKSSRSREYDHHENTYNAVDEYDVYDYKLETLCDYYGIYRDDAHRSLSDCYATAKVFEHLIEDKTQG